MTAVTGYGPTIVSYWVFFTSPEVTAAVSGHLGFNFLAVKPGTEWSVEEDKEEEGVGWGEGVRENTLALPARCIWKVAFSDFFCSILRLIFMVHRLIQKTQ